MAEIDRKTQRFLLQLGAAFVVTASIPLTSIAADAATPIDKLAALRAAVDRGQLQLGLSTSGGVSAAVDALKLAQSFDKSFDNRSPVDGQ
jgi:hypothetical protein